MIFNFSNLLNIWTLIDKITTGIIIAYCEYSHKLIIMKQQPTHKFEMLIFAVISGDRSITFRNKLSQVKAWQNSQNETTTTTSCGRDD